MEQLQINCRWKEGSKMRFFIVVIFAFLCVSPVYGEQASSRKVTGSTEAHFSKNDAKIGSILKQANSEKTNRESMVARINSVTVLRFETDKPIERMRLLLNGKQVDIQRIRTNKTGLWLAFIPRDKHTEIHCKAGDDNLLFVANISNIGRPDLSEKKHYGPGQKIILKGWAEVLKIVRSNRSHKVIETLKLEIE